VLIKITLVSFHNNECAIVAEEAYPRPSLVFIAGSDAIKQTTASSAAFVERYNSATMANEPPILGLESSFQPERIC
jgi:hypothetical protein